MSDQTIAERIAALGYVCTSHGNQMGKTVVWVETYRDPVLPEGQTRQTQLRDFVLRCGEMLLKPLGFRFYQSSMGMEYHAATREPLRWRMSVAWIKGEYDAKDPMYQRYMDEMAEGRNV
jgi:hypothetical protein